MISRVTSLIIRVGVTAARRAAVGELLMRREPLILVLLVPVSLPLVPRVVCCRRLRLGRLGGSATYAAVIPWRVPCYILLLAAGSLMGWPI